MTHLSYRIKQIFFRIFFKISYYTNFHFTLLSPKFRSNSLKKLKILHIYNFTSANAGDTILPICVRDIFTKTFNSDIRWTSLSIRKDVTSDTINYVNQFDLIVIGGGGLFISDSNYNNKSGWQWSIANDLLDKITSPISIFAVGYNQFNLAPKFPKIFHTALKDLHKKSLFFGIRNHGSIKSLGNILSGKISYQPCPTTFINYIYDLNTSSNAKKKNISFVIAFDRYEYRYKNDLNFFVNNTKLLITKLSNKYNIELVFHYPGDEMILHIDDFFKNIKHVFLFDSNPKNIIDYYSNTSLVFAMRGHAQMIPFGLGVPFISLITHPKLQWFADDVLFHKYCLEITDKEFVNKAIFFVEEIFLNYEKVRNKILSKNKQLYLQTYKNIKNIEQNINNAT